MNQNRPRFERYEYLKCKVKDLGWKLLTPLDEFINFRTNIDVECPRGHRVKLLPYHLISRGHPKEMFSENNVGLGCPKCSGRLKKIEELKSFARDHGWECVSTDYKTQRDSYEWKCPGGHLVVHSYHYFRKAQTCPTCALTPLRGADFLKLARLYGGHLISEVRDYSPRSLVWFECKVGHKFRCSYSTAKKTWCPDCKERRFLSNTKTEL